MEREKLLIEEEDAWDLVNGDLPGFKLIENNIIDKGRWTINYRLVVQRESDGKYFSAYYSRGATEYQESRQNVPKFKEVFPVQKTITVYE